MQVALCMRVFCFSLVFVFNAIMWTMFVKSLQKCSSVIATVTNTASNFFFTVSGTVFSIANFFCFVASFFASKFSDDGAAWPDDFPYFPSLIIIIRQLIRCRNMSMKSLQRRRYIYSAACCTLLTISFGSCFIFVCLLLALLSRALCHVVNSIKWYCNPTCWITSVLILYMCIFVWSTWVGCVTALPGN